MDADLGDLVQSEFENFFLAYQDDYVPVCSDRGRFTPCEKRTDGLKRAANYAPHVSGWTTRLVVGRVQH
jgi:hypothetical protein